jgi:hypothetical protein
MKRCKCMHSENEHILPEQGGPCAHLFLSASEEVGHYYCSCNHFEEEFVEMAAI